MKTGSTGVDKYSRPSVEEQNEVVIKIRRMPTKLIVSLYFLCE
jgi:hypothetical protein